MLRNNNNYFPRPFQIEVQNGKSLTRLGTSKTSMKFHSDNGAGQQPASLSGGVEEITVGTIPCCANEHRGIDEKIHY
jgi:hypothetical protein